MMINEPSGGAAVRDRDLLGSAAASPQAGEPEITIPNGVAAGSSASSSLARNVIGGPYDELKPDRRGLRYRQSTKLQAEPPGDARFRRCIAVRTTCPAEPFAVAGRGHCNPDDQSDQEPKSPNTTCIVLRWRRPRAAGRCRHDA